MKVWMIVAIYWVFCCGVVYVNRKISVLEGNAVGTKAWNHLLIVLLCPIAAPILLIAYAYGAYYRRFYKNRPKPIPKKFRKFLKKDRVLDERNNTMSIAEYNYKHGTEYTLDDVYGKGYEESLSEDEKATISRQSEESGLLQIKR